MLERRPDVQVVILTSFSDRDRILEALDAGAIGYLLKDAEPDAVLDGIRAAARGESPLAPKAARALLAERADRGSGPELSEREQEVLALVGEGLPNKLIARKLDISREDGQGALDADLPRARRRRPHAGRALGARAPLAVLRPMSNCSLDRAAGTLKSFTVRSEEELEMTRLKTRMMVIAAAALVGAVTVPLAVAEKGADDPAGHVRHAKHTKKATHKKSQPKGQEGHQGAEGQLQLDVQGPRG